MGNKISFGKYILYCGFPAKRRKTKKKEKEKRREMVEFELHQAFMNGERFKAAYPEYVKQAGLVPSTYFPAAFELGEPSDYYGQERSVKYTLENEGTAAWDKDDGLNFTGLPATDKSYNSDDSVFLRNQDGIDEELTTTQLPAYDKSFDSNLDDSVFLGDHDGGIDEELTLMGLPAAEQSYNSDDSVFLKDDSQNVTSFADDVTSDAWTQEDTPVPEVHPSVPEVDPSVPAVDPSVPEVDPSVPEVDPSVPEVDPSVPEVDPSVPEVDPSVPKEDPPVPEVDPSVPKEGPPVSNDDHPVPKRDPDVPEEDPAVSKEGPVVPKLDPPVCGKVPTVPVSEEDSNVPEGGHPVEPVSFTVPDNTPASEESSAVAIEKETPPVISSANSADDEHSTMSSPQSPTEAFNPRFTSSFMSDSEHPRPRSPPGEIISLSSQSSISLPTPPPPPPPPSRRAKSTINSDRRRARSSFSRRPLRSVTFTSTPEEDSSSNQSEVEREAARISSAREVFISQQDRDCSKAAIQVGGWTKGGQRLNGKQPLNQRSKKKESQTRSHSRTAAKLKPSPSSEIVRHPRRQSFKWNGRCVYNSGYASLVGDRIESASEDEELWEKKLAIVGPKTPVKRHVLCGQGKILDHNLIPGSRLNKDFNQEDVSVYLKERRQQCNLYHYGVAAISCNVESRKQGISGVIIPQVFKEQSCLESSAVLTALKNLHDELKHFHQDTARYLRSGLPRMLMNSMERRQTFLEARVETLESRQAVVAFKETGDENVRQQLKALREDLEQLHQTSARKRGEKEAELKGGLSFKVDKDIEIEDIEDGISVDITHHQEQSDVTPCVPEVPVRPSPTPSALEVKLKTDALAEEQTTPIERRLKLVRERNSTIRKWRMGVEETKEMGRNVEKVETGVKVGGGVEKVGDGVEKVGDGVETVGGSVEKVGGGVEVEGEVEKVGYYVKVEGEMHKVGRDVEKIGDDVERVRGDGVRKVEELGRYSKDGWNQRDSGKTLAQTNTIQAAKNSWYPEAVTASCEAGFGKQTTTVTCVEDQAIVSGQDNSVARLVKEQPECALPASKTVESCPEIPAETSVVKVFKSCLKQTSVERNNLQFGPEISGKLSFVGKNIQSGPQILAETDLWKTDIQSGPEIITESSVVQEGIYSGQDILAKSSGVEKHVHFGPQTPKKTAVWKDDIHPGTEFPEKTSVWDKGIRSGQDILAKPSGVGKHVHFGSRIPKGTDVEKDDIHLGELQAAKTSVWDKDIRSCQDILAKPSGVGKHVHFGSRIPKGTAVEKDDIHLGTELQEAKTSVLKDDIYSGLDILAKPCGVRKHVHFGPRLPKEAAVKENIHPSTKVPSEASLGKEEIHSGSSLSEESSVVDEDVEAGPESSLKSTKVTKDIQHRPTAKDIYFAPDIPTEFTVMLNNIHSRPQTLAETSVVEEDIQLDPEAPAETSVTENGLHSGSESPAEFTVSGNDIESQPEISERTSVVDENLQSFQKTPAVGEHIQSGPKTPLGTSVVESGIQSDQKTPAGTKEYIECSPDELAETTVVEEDVQSGQKTPEEILERKILAKAAVVGSDIQFGPESSEESSLVKEITPFDPKSPFGKFVSGGTMTFGNSSGQFPSRDVLFWRGTTAATGVEHKDMLHDQNRLTGTSMAEDSIQGDLEIPTENSVATQETESPIVKSGTVVESQSGVAKPSVVDDYIQSDLEMPAADTVTDVAFQVSSTVVEATQNTTAKSIGLQDLLDNRVKRTTSSIEKCYTKTNNQSGSADPLTAPSLVREDLNGNLQPVFEKPEQHTKFCRKTSVTDGSRKPAGPYFFVKEDIQLGRDSSTENSVASLQSSTETPNAGPAVFVEFQSRAEIEAEGSVVDEDIELGLNSSVEDSVASLQSSTETPNAEPAAFVEFQSRAEIEAEDSVVDEDIQCGLELLAVKSVAEMDVKTGPTQDDVVEGIQDGAVTLITESVMKEAIQSVLVVSNKDVSVEEGNQSSPTSPIAERFPKEGIQTSHQKVTATSAVKNINKLELSREYGLADKDIQFSPTTSNKVFRYEKVFGRLANQDKKSNRESSTKYSLVKKDSRRDDESSSLESSISDQDMNYCAEIPKAEPVTEITQTCQDSSASTSATDESSGRKSQMEEYIGEYIPSDKEMLSENSVQIARDILAKEREVYSEGTSPSLKSEEDDVMYESSIEEIIKEILTDEEAEDEEEEDGNQEEEGEEGREKEEGEGEGEEEGEEEEENKEGEGNEKEQKGEGKEDEDKGKDKEGNQEEDRVEVKEKGDEGEEEEEDEDEDEEEDKEEENQEEDTGEGKEDEDEGKDKEGIQEEDRVEVKEKGDEGEEEEEEEEEDEDEEEDKEEEERKEKIPSGRTVYRFDIATGRYVQTTVVDDPGLEKDIRTQTDALTDKAALEDEISAGRKTSYVKDAVDDIPCDQETLFGEGDTMCYSETKTVQSEEGYMTIGRTRTPFSVTKRRPQYGTNTSLETLNEDEILGGNEGPLAELVGEEDTSLENETEELVSEEDILPGQHTSVVQPIEEESVLFGQRTPPEKSAFKKEIRSLREKWSGGTVAGEDFQFSNLIEKYDAEDFGTRQETSTTESNSKESVESMDSIQSNQKATTASVVVKEDWNSLAESDSKETMDSMKSNEIPFNRKPVTASVVVKDDWNSLAESDSKETMDSMESNEIPFNRKPVIASVVVKEDWNSPAESDSRETMQSNKIPSNRKTVTASVVVKDDWNSPAESDSKETVDSMESNEIPFNRKPVIASVVVKEDWNSPAESDSKETVDSMESNEIPFNRKPVIASVVVKEDWNSPAESDSRETMQSNKIPSNRKTVTASVVVKDDWNSPAESDSRGTVESMQSNKIPSNRKPVTASVVVKDDWNSPAESDSKETVESLESNRKTVTASVVVKDDWNSPAESDSKETMESMESNEIPSNRKPVTASVVVKDDWNSPAESDSKETMESMESNEIPSNRKTVTASVVVKDDWNSPAESDSKETMESMESNEIPSNRKPVTASVVVKDDWNSPAESDSKETVESLESNQKPVTASFVVKDDWNSPAESDSKETVESLESNEIPFNRKPVTASVVVKEDWNSPAESDSKETVESLESNEIPFNRKPVTASVVVKEDIEYEGRVSNFVNAEEDFDSSEEIPAIDSDVVDIVECLGQDESQTSSKTSTLLREIKEDTKYNRGMSRRTVPDWNDDFEPYREMSSEDSDVKKKGEEYVRRALKTSSGPEEDRQPGRQTAESVAENDISSAIQFSVPSEKQSDVKGTDLGLKLDEDYESQTSSKTSTLLREIKEDTKYTRGMSRRTVPDWNDDFEPYREMSSEDSDVKKKGEEYVRGTLKTSSGPEEDRQPGRQTAEFVAENDISSAIQFSVPSEKHSEVKGTDLGLKLDEDYELNTLSDISSISEMAPALDTTNNVRNKEVVLQADLTNPGGSVGVHEEMHGSTNADQAHDESTVKVDQGEGKTTNEEIEKEKEKTESESSDSLSEIARQLYPEEHDKMFMTHDSGEKIKPKKVAPDPNSSVMKQLNEITSKIRPNSRLKEMAANKALREEQQRQEREASAKLYRNKPLGLRNLEKFRDDVCSKPTAFVEREVTAEEYMQHMLDFQSVAPGLHAMANAGIQDHPRSLTSALESNNEFLQQATSRGSLAPPGPRGSFPRRGLSSRNTATLPAIGSKLPSMESSPEKNDGSLRKTSPLAVRRSFRNTNEDRPRQNIPKNPYGTSDNSRVQAAFEESTPMESDFYKDVFGNEELEESKNSGRKNEGRNQGYADSSSNANQPTGSPFGVSPDYRTPEARKPAALIPLSIARKDAPGSGSDLASRAASLEAALGFGSVSDPWKPAALPMIQKSSTGLKPEDRLASVVPKPKSFFASSIMKPMKPAVLPSIGQRPLPGIGSLGKPASFDRAI